MDLTVQIPDDLAVLMRAGGDLSRRALEALAAEEYRHGRLAKPDLRRLLGFETSHQIDEFLKAHEVFEEYTLADLGARARRLAAFGLFHSTRLTRVIPDPLGAMSPPSPGASARFHIQLHIV